MPGKNQIEPLEDGWVAFRTEDGDRWRHRDETRGRVGEGYRIFVSDGGEERRYHFGPDELHDATISDLRDQLRKAEPVPRDAPVPDPAGPVG